MSEGTRQEILEDMRYYQECDYPVSIMLDVIMGDYAISKKETLLLYAEFISGEEL